MNEAAFVIKRNRLTRRYRVLLVGRNHEPLSVSETLNSIAAAYVNIDAQRVAAANAPIIEK